MRWPHLPIKNFIWRTIGFVSVIVLLANTIRIYSVSATKGKEVERLGRTICLLQVQFMDRILSSEKGQKLDQLIENPDQWLNPLRERVNSDPKLCSLLRQIAFISKNKNEFVVYCNPVDDSTEPYEEFRFRFNGDECTSIERKALCPW